MQTGCQKNCVNCCICNCVNSICVTISEIIFSLLGTIINSISISFFNKTNLELTYFFILHYINISYFGSSSVISIILLIVKKLELIERICWYKFGNYSTLLYSYISKILAILNIIGFFYIFGFASFVTIYLHIDEAKDLMPVTYVGSNGYFNLVIGQEGVGLDCSEMECFDEEKKEENLINIGYKELLIFCISSISSIIFTFINGATFSSEKERISHLIKGKLEIEFIPIESKSLFDKYFCFLSNSITCYRLTVLRILNFISIISAILFVDSLITFIIGIIKPWPQALFFQNNFGTPIGFFISLLIFFSSIYCSGVELCDFHEPPSKRKCTMLLLVILTILFFPIELLGFTFLFSSQIGASKFALRCTQDEPCDELFSIDDYYDYRNKYTFIFNIKEASVDKQVLGFILGIIHPFCCFFLMVLMITYIGRALIEYNTPNRAYEANLFLIEDNGNKNDLNNYEIVTKKTSIKKLINNVEVEEQIIIYYRNIKSNEVINI